MKPKKLSDAERTELQRQMEEHQTMSSESRHIKKGRHIKIIFLGKWVLVTTIVWPVGVVVSFIVPHMAEIIFGKTNFLVGLSFGAVVGYAQWFVLKTQIPRSSWWGLSCTIGMGIPFMVLNIDLRVLVILGGLLTGLLQIRVLIPYSTKSNWWILATPIASPIGWGLCWLSVAGSDVSLWGLGLGGVILGVITGSAILCILKFPVQESSTR